MVDIRDYDVKVVKQLVSEKNYPELAKYMKEHGLVIKGGKVKSKNIEWLESNQKLYDLMQYIKKIVINSSYGSLLNCSCVVYDFRLGASTTLTGRLVTKHMAERINDYTIKKCIHTGGTLIGGDTDSEYLSIGCKAFREANPDFVYTKENVTQYVDKLTAYVDSTFAKAMKDHHHVDDEHADIMHCAREIVGDYGLYIKKKRYAIMVYDDEGHRQDVDGKPGKLKIRGIQTQRADMPKAVKKLLKDMLVKVLTGGTEQEVQQMVLNFSQTEWDVEPWKKGTPKPVNKLNQYMEKLKEGCDGMNAQKITIPSQVRGAINWNNLIDYYGDTQTKKFAGGEKCLMCKLKPENMLKLDVVCIPIDIDPTTIPQWFKDLPFDTERTDEAVINKTIDSIFGILGWDLHLSSLTKPVVDDSDLDIQML